MSNIPTKEALDSFIIKNMPMWVARVHATNGDNYYLNLLQKHKKDQEDRPKLRLIKD